MIVAALAHMHQNVDAAGGQQQPEQHHGGQVVTQPKLWNANEKKQGSDDAQVIQTPVGPLVPGRKNTGQAAGDDVAATLKPAGALGAKCEKDDPRTASEQNQVGQSPDK